MFQFSPGLSFRFPETCLKAPETRFGIGSTQRTGRRGGPERGTSVIQSLMECEQ